MNKCPLNKSTRNIPENIYSRILDIHKLWKKADKCDVSPADASFLEDTAKKAQSHINKFLLYSSIVSDEKKKVFEKDVCNILNIVEVSLKTFIKNKNITDSVQIDSNMTITKQKATLDGLDR